MDARPRSRWLVLVLAFILAGCHLPRPGEATPDPVAACSDQRLAELEGRFEHLEDRERELLTYCRTAQAAEALSASQEHLDYQADLQFLGILLTLASTAAILAVR